MVADEQEVDGERIRALGVNTGCPEDERLEDERLAGDYSHAAASLSHISSCSSSASPVSNSARSVGRFH